MAIVTQNNNLNIQSGSVPVTVHLSQGDVGNTVGFYIYNGSEPVIMNEYQISVHGIRQDGVGFGPYQVSKRTHSNYVYFNITNDMTAVRGAALAELTITNGSGASVGTANFAMLVERGTFPNGPVYDTDISVYQQILNYVQTIPASVRADIADLQSQTHDIVADMKADTNLKTGMYVRTGGYYAVNDGGGALYRIYNTAPATYYERLNNGLYAELIYYEHVTPEMFGAKGDGTTDDSQALVAAFTSGYPVLLSKKTYFASNPIVVQNVNDLRICGEGTVIKLYGNASASISNIAALQFKNCNNIVIDGITVDSGNSWIKRPLTTSADFQAYQNQRNKTHDGISFSGCSFVRISNCIAQNCCAGFYVSASTNVIISGCQSVQTMADGVFVTGGSEHVIVFGHNCVKCDDDCYSAISYVQNRITKNVAFEDCTASDCFGALVCMYGTLKCKAIRCNGEGHQYSPFKLGSWSYNSVHLYGEDQTVKDCYVILADVIEPNNGTVLINGFNGEADYTKNIRIENCSVIKTGSSAYTLKVLPASGITLIAMTTQGFALDITGVHNLLVRNCDLDTTAIIPFASSNDIVLDSNKFKNNYVSTGVMGACFYIQGTENVKMLNNRYIPYPGAKDFYINGTSNVNVLIDSNSFTKSNGYTGQVRFDGVFDNVLGLDVTMFKDGQLVLLNNNLYILISGAPVKLNNA